MEAKEHNVLSTLRNRASRLNVTPLYLLAVLLVSLAFLMHDLSPANASSIHDLKAKMKAIAASADANTVRAEFATMIASPTVVAYAQQLLLTDSNMSAFDINVLQAVVSTQPYVSLLSAVISGTPLTAAQKKQLTTFAKTFNNNPAVQQLTSLGKSLKSNPTALQADINATVASDTGPYVQIPKTGDDTFDAFNTTIQGVLSPSMQTISGNVNGVLTDPNAEAYIASLPPSVVIHDQDLGYVFGHSSFAGKTRISVEEKQNAGRAK